MKYKKLSHTRSKTELFSEEKKGVAFYGVVLLSFDDGGTFCVCVLLPPLPLTFLLVATRSLCFFCVYFFSAIFRSLLVGVCLYFFFLPFDLQIGKRSRRKEHEIERGNDIDFQPVLIGRRAKKWKMSKLYNRARKKKENNKNSLERNTQEKELPDFHLSHASHNIHSPAFQKCWCFFFLLFFFWTEFFLPRFVCLQLFFCVKRSFLGQTKKNSERKTWNFG